MVYLFQGKGKGEGEGESGLAALALWVELDCRIGWKRGPKAEGGEVETQEESGVCGALGPGCRL